MCEISHLSVYKDELKLGQHYQFPNTNVLFDLIIELQEFLQNKRSWSWKHVWQREERTRDEETERHGKTEAGANGATTEEEEEEEDLMNFIVFCFLKRSWELQAVMHAGLKWYHTHAHTHSLVSGARGRLVLICSRKCALRSVCR